MLNPNASQFLQGSRLAYQTLRGMNWEFDDSSFAYTCTDENLLRIFIHLARASRDSQTMLDGFMHRAGFPIRSEL